MQLFALDQYHFKRVVAKCVTFNGHEKTKDKSERGKKIKKKQNKKV